MVIRSDFERAQDVVELRETKASPEQLAPTLQPSSNIPTPIPPAACLFESQILSSKEGVQRKVEDMKSNYTRAVDTDLPTPIAVSEVAEAQPLSTLTLDNPSFTRSSAVHKHDVTLVSQSSSAVSEIDSLRSSTPAYNTRTSPYPAGDFRNSSIPDINDMKTEIMCNYLHQQQLKKMWSNGSLEEGVLLKKSRGEYTCCPSDLRLQRHGLFDAVKILNVRVCRFAQARRNAAD